MPDEDGDKDRNEYDDHDAERCRSAAVFAVTVHYNRAISHTGSCSFRRTVPRYTHDRQARNPLVTKHTLMWNGIGLALCCIVAATGVLQSNRAHSGYYAGEVYGMTARSHRAYATLSALFAVLFIFGFFTAAIPAVPLLGAYALVFIFYFSSFARGFSDEE